MPKYVDPTAFQPPIQQKTGMNAGLDNLDKISQVLDKGLKIFDSVQMLMKYKQQQQMTATDVIEIKADKMAERKIAQAEAVREVEYREPVITMIYKTDDAEAQLDELLNKLDQLGIDTSKSLSQFIVEDYQKLKSAGFVKMGIETILKKFVEVKTS